MRVLIKYVAWQLHVNPDHMEEIECEQAEAITSQKYEMSEWVHHCIFLCLTPGVLAYVVCVCVGGGGRHGGDRVQAVWGHHLTEIQVLVSPLLYFFVSDTWSACICSWGWGRVGGERHGGGGGGGTGGRFSWGEGGGLAHVQRNFVNYDCLRLYIEISTK